MAVFAFIEGWRGGIPALTTSPRFTQFSPLDTLHGVVEGMLTEIRQAWDDTGDATFVYSLPSELVPPEEAQ